MAEGESIDRLRLQKQALLLESGLNRMELRHECSVVREHFAWVNDPVGAARENGPLLMTVAPLVGVLASRLLRTSRPGTSKLTLVIDFLRVGWPLWRQFAAGYFRTRH
ncbi:MAG: hypothetical protein DVB31_04350 [Verrucomicrobia bacterium]|nr:MAG: hypothetical protein DVB31_04350 [Verrucomicrobiota bacterium]